MNYKGKLIFSLNVIISDNKILSNSISRILISRFYHRQDKTIERNKLIYISDKWTPNAFVK
jgi:hypothetical protein